MKKLFIPLLGGLVLCCLGLGSASSASAQEFKEHIKKDNNWSSSDGFMIVEDEPPGNN